MSDTLYTGAIPDDRLCDYLDEAKGAAQECKDCGEIFCPNAGEEACPYCCEHEDESVVRVQPSATKGRADVTLRCRCGRERTINVPRCDQCGEPARYLLTAQHFAGFRCADCTEPTKAVLEVLPDQRGWGPVRVAEIIGWRVA